MTKVIKKENVAKKITVSCEIDGKVISTQTTKNCVGKKIPAAPKCIACQKKNAAGNQTKVAIICNAKSKPVVVVKKRKDGKKGTDLSYAGDFFGIKRNSSMYEFVLYLLVNGPSSMGQVKKDIRRTHYQTTKKFPGLFIQGSDKKWSLAV